MSNEQFYAHIMALVNPNILIQNTDLMWVTNANIVMITPKIDESFSQV